MNALQHRTAQIAVRAALLRRLIPLWPLLDKADLDGTLPRWLAAAAPTVLDGRKASAALAAHYYREARHAAGITGRAPVEMAAAAPAAQLMTSLTVTSLVAVRRALGNGQDIDQAMQTGFVMSGGAATRLALQGGRQTILDSVRADPSAVGWERIAAGGCDFCQMLAGRGAVYSEATADFEAHDHCACSAAPIYA